MSKGIIVSFSLQVESNAYMNRAQKLTLKLNFYEGHTVKL